MRRLRIAMCISSATFQGGGIQEHVYFLSDALRKRGHTVEIFGPNGDKYGYKSYHPIGQSVEIPFPTMNGSRIHVLGKDALDVETFLQKGAYDILHVQEPDKPFVSWKFLHESTVPTVVSFHNAWEDDSALTLISPFFSLLSSLLGRNVRAAIFVSKHGQNLWKHVCGPHVVQRVISNAPDPRILPGKYSVRSRSRLELLFMARLVPRKGLQYLLQAMEHLLQWNIRVHLTVVGDGQDRKRMEAYVQEKKLQNQVTFVGQKLGLEKIKYFKEADIFCAPYTGESFSIAILEAFAAGCPIVGFYNAPFKSTFKGYPFPSGLVKTKNVLDLAKAIKVLAEKDSLRTAIHQWEIEQSKKYRWEQIAEQTENLYFKILQ